MMPHNRILVVEDEDNVRDVLAEFLSYRGYLVETAANGLKALPKLGEFAPDLILTDLQMPGLNGFGLIRRAHEQDPDQAIVVMSALAQAERTLSRLARLDGASKGEYAQDVANDIRASMQQHAGVFRTQESMDEGVAKIAALRERVKGITLKDKSKVFNTARIEALEVENLIECAQATMVSAAARRECRGAHTVYDYEKPADDPVSPLGRDDANWMKHTLWHSASNSLTYKPVNLKPLTVDSVPPKVRTF